MSAPRSLPVTIAQLLAGARARLVRLDPEQAAARLAAGALLVDIRPQWQRATAGEIPGSTVIERNHLEWRLDPSSDAALPVADHALEVVVVCEQGYTSSLAAAALQDLGIASATDLAGGFEAWAAAGLPVREGVTGPNQVVPGSSGATPSRP